MPISIHGNGTVNGVTDFASSNIELIDPQVTGGFYLNGTGAANYLDDYEEGSFSPGFDGKTASGFYVKIGRLCFFNITISFAGTAGEVTGLPFLSSTYSNYEGFVYQGRSRFVNYRDSNGVPFVALVNLGRVLFRTNAVNSDDTGASVSTYDSRARYTLHGVYVTDD